MKNDFVHLHLHSQYSLLDGAIKFDELFDEVARQGMSAVALTDHGNLFGAYDFYKLGKKNNIKPIIGCEVYITKDRTKKTPENNKTHHLTVLCMNIKGYENLCSLVSTGHLEGFYRKPRIDRELLFEKSEGLIVLSGCLNSEVCHNILKGKKDEALRIASEYKNALGDRYFIEIQGTLLKEQVRVNSTLREIASKLKIPVVATNDCHYLTKDCYHSHDALLCIQTNSLVKEEKRFRFSGNEFYLKSRDEMLTAVDNYEESLENTLQIAERCNLEFNQNDYRLPKIDNSKILSNDNFESLIDESLDCKARDGLIPSSNIMEYKKRIKHELDIISSMGFEGYFLVVSDFIKYAKSSNIPVGPGRGSAAGSLIAYLLDITEVDPIKHGLIFERFLNPERISMPDIDIDFCGEGRDEVIQYVTKKYGQDKVAQIGTFGTMSSKAVIKDVGRVLGFNFGDVNKITNLIPSFRGKVYSLDECYKKIKEFKTLINSSPQFTELYKLGLKLENSVRHSSTHAAGVVISDESLDKMIPLYKGSRGETVTQYDMNAVEDLGFVKFDFLGLKTLTVIKKAKEFIVNQGIEIEELLKKSNLNDKKIFSLLSSGLTRGIFQIESSGMKDVLQNLKADKFDDLVALLALYRPGPLDSGMVEDYILRKNGKRNVDYPMPELKDILKETHGLFVYQEQIMQTASILANFSLGDADLLRRAMGKKKASEMLAQKQKFMDGTKKNKIPEKIALDIFNTMEKFAEYSFNKSHSTAYAYITFQTAFLKSYFPCEFMSALMSSEINLSEKIVSNIRECKEMGIKVLPPDINESGSGFTPLKQSIRFGLNAIKNIGTNIVSNIIKIRNDKGGFTNLFEFLSLMDSRKMNKKSLESLITSGSLDCFNYNRSTLFDNLDLLLSYVGQKSKANDTNQETLFSLEETITEPTLTIKDEWSDFEISKREIQTLGYSIKLKPLDIVKDKLSKIKFQTIDDIKKYTNKQIVTIAAFITSIEVKTSKRNSSKYALINLEDSTNIIEAIIFSGEFEKHESALQVGAPILITGSVEREEENFKLIINSYNDVDSVRLISNISIPVLIKIDRDLNNKDTEKLKNIFDKFPGNSPVEIFYKYNGLQANISINGITVDNSIEFQQEIKDAIG
ncbi:MAG: DNA polymerase III subunit alpha [Candidatus Dadabacteria bacterium]|nr:MAG: DNA polymerase III subunit alpha [Candidatus Dadabacteria bacterium]